jgi:hypothetical protein
LSQILIDRKTLQLLLDQYFELEAENRAYRHLMNQARLKSQEASEAARRYVGALQKEKEKARSQIRGQSQRLTLHLADAEDDAAFLRALSDLLPPRQPRTAANPQT